MVKFFVKRYVLKKVNEVIAAINKKVDLDKYLLIVEKALLIAQKASNLIQTLKKALEDKQLTEDESKEIVQKAKEMFE